MAFDKFVSVLLILCLVGLSFAASPSPTSYRSTVTTPARGITLVNNSTSSSPPLPTVNTNLPVSATIGPLAYVVGDIKTPYGQGMLTDTGIYVIDTNSYDYNEILIANGINVRSIGVSPDGSTLYAAATSYKTITDETGTYETQFSWLFRINTKNGEIIDKYDLGKWISIRDLSVAPNGKVYVSWEVNAGAQSGEDVFDFKANKHWGWNWKDYFDFNHVPLGVAFNSDGSIAYFGSMDPNGWIYIFDWNSNKIYRNYVEPSTEARAIASDSTASRVCTVHWDDTFISCLLNGNSRAGWDTGYYPTDLKFSPDGKTLYVIGYDTDTYAGKLHIYSGLALSSSMIGYIADQQIPLTFIKGKTPNRIAITPDWKYAYITSGSDWAEGVAVVDLAGGYQVTTVPVPTDRFGNIAIASQQTLWNSSKGSFKLADLLLSTQISGLVSFPYVIYASPTGNSISLGTTVSAKFSTSMDAGTINSDSFVLLNSRNYKVSGAVSYSNGVAVFTPSSKLLANATYTATLKSSIKDSNGKAISEYSWKFRTGSGIASFVGISRVVSAGGTGKQIFTNFSNGNQTNSSIFKPIPANIPPIIPGSESSGSSSGNSGSGGGSSGSSGGSSSGAGGSDTPGSGPDTSTSNSGSTGSGIQTPSPAGGSPVACTAEAKICPDGSAVGRTGPNCEFSPCPGEKQGGGDEGTPAGTGTQQPAPQRDFFSPIGDFFGGIASFFKGLLGMK